MSETNYPLLWPTGWKRTAFPSPSRFGGQRRYGLISMARAVDDCLEELRRLGGINALISTNVEVKRDGTPYANRARPSDTGAAVYFTLKQKRLVMACDKWNRVEDNIWAITKHIEATRGQERWGVGSVEQAFSGYAALPAASSASCWDVLGIVNPAIAGESTILSIFRDKAQIAHPDKGGTAEAFRKLTEARDEALKIIRIR